MDVRELMSAWGILDSLGEVGENGGDSKAVRTAEIGRRYVVDLQSGRF